MTLNKLSKIQFFYASENAFTGAYMWEALPVQLTDLDLSSNSLYGTIPFGSSNHKLGNLYVRDNSFSGTIPDNIALLRDVQNLDLSFNLFSGTLNSQFNSVWPCYLPIFMDMRL